MHWDPGRREAPKFDAADWIAGHLLCSRGHAYELMARALNESGHWVATEITTDEGNEHG